jgi:hypothetical protein
VDTARASVFAGLLAIALALPGVAAAQDGPDQDLAAVRELVLHANYRAALPAVRTFLQRDDLGAEQRNAGLEVLAIVNLALRDESAARQALTELYSRDPGHRLGDPDASPVVQSAFARARDAAQVVEVSIDHTPPVLERRTAPTVRVQVTAGASAVHEVRLLYRARGARRFTTTVMPIDASGAAEGRIPVQTEDEAPYVVEYYAEAIAPSGTVLGRTGEPDAPLTIDVPAAQQQVIVQASTPGVDTPPQGDDTGMIVLGVVIGVLVVGGGVGAGVGIWAATQGPQNGSLGTITLPLATF